MVRRIATTDIVAHDVQPEPILLVEQQIGHGIAPTIGPAPDHIAEPTQRSAPALRRLVAITGIDDPLFLRVRGRVDRLARLRRAGGYHSAGACRDGGTRDAPAAAGGGIGVRGPAAASTRTLRSRVRRRGASGPSAARGR